MTQLELLSLHPCPTCRGKGWQTDTDGNKRYCRTCEGSGLVDYDPEDTTEFGF